MYQYDSVDFLVNEAEKNNKKISELILKEQAERMEITRDDLYSKMEKRFEVMEEAVKKGSMPGLRSVSGLSGGDAYKMKCQVDRGENLCGPLFGHALTKALAVSELNSCMGKIVAAPTAGSCGIIPSAVLTIMEDKNIDRKDAVMSLFTASGIGIVIANKASISGAEGGCQAECGTASAMAAAAITEMAGGTPRMISNAAAIALKNILGLVCDPVAGLVEVPCIKRNAMGTANALTAAELALAGIESRIPVDEVIEAMKKIGDMMPSCLKETAQGGLADTKTGRFYKKAGFDL
ncbi:MAG: L-serine ammonia-lyase, iron-sulfur-dependent, subunit alpha [Clostridiales bacterium]|nr:L-serine ammonia-lyase, iron-sulfur-dependent, subunit alpha [Clostridiales bacterium]